ncbi:MAG: insulinase family protein [Bacteroidales bacterium]|jgi:zinc protease|nr:insulinase family protein [Bacteroidales bacterium]
MNMSLFAKIRQITYLLLSGCLLSVHAQDFDLQSLIPADTSIVIRQLDNGLKYYLRYNAKPEKRVEFRLAVKTGSICETDQQKGLAHFVEHMCFNGTENFKENDLIKLLEEMGVKFGNDLNAYTSFDETVYRLQVPSDRTDLMDKAFQIMEDWAHQVSFADKEIDAERGVIVEEWRMGLGANDRMLRKYLPVMFHGSRYAERLPIGDMDIVKNAPYEELRRFYRDWYRPELMALVVVGDMPVKEMEEKVKKHFAGIENPKNAPERIKYDMPGNKEPLIAIVTDKEATRTIVQMLTKLPKSPVTRVEDYRTLLVQTLYNNMINHRFEEIAHDPDAPFLYAGSSYGDFYGPTDVYASVAMAKENEIDRSLLALLTENERVKKFGFTQSELEREKQEILARYDKIDKEAGKNTSGELVDEYVRNFIDGEPIPGPKLENAYAQHFMPGIALEEVNRLAQQWVTDDNLCVIVTAPEKETAKIPTEEDIISMLQTAKQSDITAYVDQVVDQPLIASLPEGSRVFRRKDNPDFGTTELTFMNGVKIMLKHTDFQNDEILFAGFSPGGTSVYTDEDYMSATMAAGIVSQSGLGEFDQIALGKKLAGKTVRLSPYISELWEGLGGSTTPKDLETLLQLNYLHFTAARRDEEAFKAYMSRIRNQVQNMKSNPMNAYMDTLYRIVSCHHPRTVVIPSEKQLEQINLNNAMNIFHDRFADASDFSFVLVGNFELKTLIPLLEKYLGGLPSKQRKETWRDVTPQFPQGIVRYNDPRNSEPQSRVNIFMKGDFKWKYKERLQFSLLRDILNIKLRESMREDQGGVYGVQLSASAGPYPKPTYSVTVQWGCAPENADKLENAVFAEMNKIKTEGPQPVDLNKVKEIMIRERETSMKENAWWQNTLLNAYRYNEPPVSLEEFKKAVQAITAKDIKNIARKYLSDTNYVAGRLMPAETTDN